jgi:hypothetical protein
MTGPVILSLVFARASFCLFLLSVIGAKKYVRTLLWAALISQALVNISQVILEFSSCGSHITAIWDHSVPAKCVNFITIIDYLYFLSGLYHYSPGSVISNCLIAWNACTDLFLTILPALLLKGIQIDFKKKIVIMILLCMSAL